MNAAVSNERDENLTLAIQHHHAGRLDEAEKLYQRLFRANGRDSEVIFLLGVLCCDLGLYDSACKFLEQAITITPNFPEARAQLAIALNGMADLAISAGKLSQAQEHLEKALEWSANDAQSLKGLGQVALLRDNAATAEVWLEASQAQRPDDAQSLNWLGLARLQLGHNAAAETALRSALQVQPDLDQARNNLGLALHRQGAIADARVLFEQTLERDPAYVPARLNLANALRVLGELDAARRELESVLAVRPHAVDALNNLGAVLQDMGEPELALERLTHALKFAPASPQVRWNLSLTQLQLGDFTSGWSNFESRWTGCDHLRGVYQMPAARAWRGEPLAGKTLLLWAEQGYGDTIQFIRFAQDLARMGATVKLLAPRELAALLRSAPGVDAVVAGGEPVPKYDYHLPLMSLPYRLGVVADPTELHGATPYLAAATPERESWQQRMRRFPGLKVGVAWAGTARLPNADLAAIDARRSMSFERLAPLLAVGGCSFFSLQKGAARPAPAAGPLGGRGLIQDYMADITDFSATAAIIANLDLVISVDTAVAHLAGALGKPVWLLNRYDACWRWMQVRTDSPWYSTLRQFRQPRPGDWESVIAAAAAALGAAAAPGAATASR